MTTVPPKTLVKASGHTERIGRITFSNDNNLCVTSSDDFTALVISLEGKKSGVKTVLPSRGDVSCWVAACAIDTKASKFAVLGSYDASYDLVGWSLSPPYNELFRLQGHGGTLTCVEFNPTNPDELLSASGDYTSKIWDLSQITETNNKIKHKWEIKRSTQYSYSCGYSSCGRLAFATDAFGTMMLVYAFDVQEGKLLYTFPTGHDSTIYTCVGRKDFLFTAGCDAGIVQKWNVSRLLEMKKKTGGENLLLLGQSQELTSTEFPFEAQIEVAKPGGLDFCDVTHDASFLAAMCTSQRKVAFYEIKAKEFVALFVLNFEAKDSVMCLAFSPDASLVGIGARETALIFQNPFKSRWDAALPVFELRELGNNNKNRICRLLKDEWRAFQCVVLFMPHSLRRQLGKKEKKKNEGETKEGEEAIVKKEVEMRDLFPETVELLASSEDAKKAF